jgi:hypothetical protein
MLCSIITDGMIGGWQDCRRLIIRYTGIYMAVETMGFHSSQLITYIIHHALPLYIYTHTHHQYYIYIIIIIVE